MENSMEVSQKKLKAEPPYYPAIPLLGICLGKTVTGKDTGTPIFTIYISQDMKAIYVSINRRTDKEGVVRVYDGNITQP